MRKVVVIHMPNESLKMKKQITKGMKTEFDLVIFYTTIGEEAER